MHDKTKKHPLEPKAVVFDLDGTLTPVTSPWRFVHEAFGVWEKAVRYHDEFFAGGMDYETWAKLDTALWKGRTLLEVRSVLEKIEPTPEGIEILKKASAYRNERGEELALLILSSGFDEIAGRLLKKAGIEANRVKIIANGLREEQGKVVPISRVKLNDEQADKRAHLKRFLAEHGLTPADCIALDDRKEDEALYEGFGRFIHIETPQSTLELIEYLS